MWSELDVPRIEALFAHWSLEPPVGIIVAHALGIKTSRPAAEGKTGAPSGKSYSQLSDDERRRQAEELISIFPGGMIR